MMSFKIQIMNFSLQIINFGRTDGVLEGLVKIPD